MNVLRGRCIVDGIRCTYTNETTKTQRRNGTLLRLTRSPIEFLRCRRFSTTVPHTSLLFVTPRQEFPRSRLPDDTVKSFSPSLSSVFVFVTRNMRTHVETGFVELWKTQNPTRHEPYFCSRGRNSVYRDAVFVFSSNDAPCVPIIIHRQRAQAGQHARTLPPEHRDCGVCGTVQRKLTTGYEFVNTSSAYGRSPFVIYCRRLRPARNLTVRTEFKRISHGEFRPKYCHRVSFQ